MSFDWPSTEPESDWLLLVLLLLLLLEMSAPIRVPLAASRIPGSRELARLLPLLEVLVSNSFLAFLRIEKCIKKSMALRMLNVVELIDEDDDDDDWLTAPPAMTGVARMDTFCWFGASRFCCCMATFWLLLKWPPVRPRSIG